MLQASYMRKWMSERLKRRKKAGDGPSKETTQAPEPLQPRFYDDEPGVESGPAVETAAAPEGKGASAKIPAAELERVSKHGARSEPETATEPTAAPVAASGGDVEAKVRTSRRRRGRGGRGGNRGRTAASPPAPVVAEGLTDTEPSLAESSIGEIPTPESVVAAVPPSTSQRAVSLTSQAMPSATAPPPARASKGTVVLAIGLPGSGKSSWFKRHNIHPLSSDLLRELLFDDAQEQRFQDLVFSNLRSMLKARLIARRPMNYVDATNLTPHDRHSWIKLAKDYGYDVQGLFFDVPLEICMERHQRRGRVVPEEIMRKMAGKLKAPTFDEGFSKITVVRVKQKEAAAG